MTSHRNGVNGAMTTASVVRVACRVERAARRSAERSSSSSSPAAAPLESLPLSLPLLYLTYTLVRSAMNLVSRGTTV